MGIFFAYDYEVYDPKLQEYVYLYFNHGEFNSVSNIEHLYIIIHGYISLAIFAVLIAFGIYIRNKYYKEEI